MNIKCFLRLLVASLMFISCNSFADEKSTKTDAPTIRLYKEALRNIPFAVALCSKSIRVDNEENCIGSLMQGLAVLIAQNSDVALNEPLIELAEIYFGASSYQHWNAVINRGNQIVPVLQQRLSNKSKQCTHYTLAEQLFLNEGDRNFRCWLDPLKNAEFVESARQSLLLSISEKKQHKPRPWPEGLMQSDATQQDIDVIVPRIIRWQLLQIPALQAAHIRSKGAEG